MSELFVQLSIKINAPVARVWDVIVDPDLNIGWAHEFVGQPAIIKSNWGLDDRVDWLFVSNGNVFVTGYVTAIKPGELLRFTVFDVSAERPTGLSDQDGITFTFEERGAYTTLSLSQGDFGKMEDGTQYYEATVLIWEKVLPMMKTIAEG